MGENAGAAPASVAPITSTHAAFSPRARRDYMVEALTEVIPDVVHAVFTFERAELDRVPPGARPAMAGLVGWSILVYAVPITDDGLWVWHQHGEVRSLMANYVLARAREHLAAAAAARGDEIVSVSELTGQAVSMVELGELAGLGTRGWNNLLLHPQYGSWLQIEAVATPGPLTANLIADYPDDVCVKCMNCITDCPAGAIAVDDFNASACSKLVASPWNIRSRAVALTAHSYIECRVCITSCPIGEPAEGLFAWQRQK